MFRLRTGYLISAILTGLALFVSFLGTLPDGKLHIVFCDVGQGDALYIRMPDGRDMLIDGGPDTKVISCLSRHMPFWDRQIDIAVATHHQKDHIGGLVEVLRRYRVFTVIQNGAANPGVRISDEFSSAVKAAKAAERLVSESDRFTIGAVRFHVVWPSAAQLSTMRSVTPSSSGKGSQSGQAVLGQQAPDPNDGSVVLLLTYGDFDAFFPGDADNRVNHRFRDELIGPDPVEVLKVPHHGSKSGINRDLLSRLKSEIAVISVGRNSYGHPSPEAVELLEDFGVRTYRTDQSGDIEVVTNGRTWKVVVHDTR